MRRRRAVAWDGPPRAAIYVRVSDPKQTDGTSLDTQEEGCRRFVAERGWLLQEHHVFREVFSGAYLDRPEFGRLRDTIDRREIEHVVVWHSDRFGRDPDDRVYLRVEAKRRGVTYVSVCDPMEDTPEGRLVDYIAGYAAGIERRSFARRSQEGLQKRARGGRPLGTAIPPYGLKWRSRWDTDPRTGEPVEVTKVGYDPDPVTVVIVRRIYDECDAGMSLRAIGLGLERDKIYPPRHAKTGATSWSTSTLRLILTSRLYTGEGTAYRWATKKHPDGLVTQWFRDADDCIPLPAGVFPEIISKDQFERVGRRLATNKQNSVRPDRDPHTGILRRGFGRCGHCGNALTVAMSSKGKPVYRCNQNVATRHGCPYNGIFVAELDPHVWAWIEEVLERPERYLSWMDPARVNDRTGEQVAALDARIADIETRRDRLVARFSMIEDDDAAKAIAAQIDALANDRRAVATERDALTARHRDADTARDRVESATTHARAARGRLGDRGWDDQRRALADLGAQVSVYHRHHPVRWEMALTFGSATADLVHHSTHDSHGQVVMSGTGESFTPDAAEALELLAAIERGEADATPDTIAQLRATAGYSTNARNVCKSGIGAGTPRASAPPTAARASSPGRSPPATSTPPSRRSRPCGRPIWSPGTTPTWRLAATCIAPSR